LHSVHLSLDQAEGEACHDASTIMRGASLGDFVSVRTS